MKGDLGNQSFGRYQDIKTVLEVVPERYKLRQDHAMAD
jgi:hypothetical protein